MHLPIDSSTRSHHLLSFYLPISYWPHNTIIHQKFLVTLVSFSFDSFIFLYPQDSQWVWWKGMLPSHLPQYYILHQENQDNLTITDDFFVGITQSFFKIQPGIQARFRKGSLWYTHGTYHLILISVRPRPEQEEFWYHETDGRWSFKSLCTWCFLLTSSEKHYFHS